MRTRPDPSASHAAAGDDEHRPIGDRARARAGRPVRSATPAAIGRPAQAAMAPIATTTMAATLRPSNQKTLAPRTLSTAIGPSSHDSLGGGNTFRTTAMNDQDHEREQRHVADELDVRPRRAAHDEVLRQAGDRRSASPSTVASTMPGDRQAQRVEQALDEGVLHALGRAGTLLDGIGKPAGWSRKSNSVGRFEPLGCWPGSCPTARRPDDDDDQDDQRRQLERATPGRGRPARSAGHDVGGPALSCRAVSGRAQRYGGAYCRPPSDPQRVQAALLDADRRRGCSSKISP